MAFSLLQDSTSGFDWTGITNALSVVVGVLVGFGGTWWAEHRRDKRETVAALRTYNLDTVTALQDAVLVYEAAMETLLDNLGTYWNIEKVWPRPAFDNSLMRDYAKAQRLVNVLGSRLKDDDLRETVEEWRKESWAIILEGPPANMPDALQQFKDRVSRRGQATQALIDDLGRMLQESSDR